MEHIELQRLSACPICSSASLGPMGSARDNLVSGLSFCLERCTNCGFLFTNPRPTSATISRFYESPNYISHSGNSQAPLSRLYFIARSITLRNKRRSISRRVRHGRVLDFGAGTGAFLSYLSNSGYDTMGVEPSSDARSIAHAQGLTLVPSASDLPPHGQFDVITLWHVLEHLHDPGPTLSLLKSHLRPSGYIFIAVPNNSSLDATYYGAHWAALDVPRHLSHFRTVDIVRLLRQNGLAVVSTRPMYFDAPYISILSEKNKGRGPLFALLLGLALGAWSNIVSILRGLPTSSTLYVVQAD